MCGIAAFFNIGEKKSITTILKDMGSLIEHRGPDDEGYAFFSEKQGVWEVEIYGGEKTNKPVFNSEHEYCPKKSLDNGFDDYFDFGFCHRRLSIIDLSSAGHQPMSYKNRYWIIYNGEIYNYIELKDELSELGHNFRSHTDTEVILAAYDQWGIDCQNHFNGMWAFLIFDIKEGKLFGSRDRFGIKPFYYWHSQNEHIAFASEIKAFTKIPGWNPYLNKQRGYDFLVHGFIDHIPETLFKDVFQLSGGDYFLIDINNIGSEILIKKWYNFPFNEDHISLKESANIYLKKLSESVNIHLRSDVSIGSCLSGGLDSSAIVTLISEMNENNASQISQYTFSARSSHIKWDEFEYMNEIVKGKKIDAHYVTPDINQLWQDLKMILWHQDEPFRSTSIFAQWCVFQLAKNNKVKVLLDGQGADESIGGYQYFIDIYIADKIINRKLITVIKMFNILRKKDHRTFFEQLKSIGFFIKINHSKSDKKISDKEEMIFPMWMNKNIMNVHSTFPLSLPNNKNLKNLFTNYCYQQIKHTSLPALLHYEDRNSMAHSIESRVPYLNHHFVEYIINLPPDYKIKNLITKYIMRIALKGILPEKVRCRMDKLGFETPEEYWVCNEEPDQFRTYLKNAIIQSNGIITSDALTLFEDMISGKRKYDGLIWRIIIFGMWMDLFQVKTDNSKNN